MIRVKVKTGFQSPIEEEISYFTASRSTPAQGRCGPLPPEPKLILIIDNSLTIQKIVEMILRREGYETRSFRNGIDAMKWLTCPESRTPDLMLVDLSLPKIDGYEVIRKCKAKPRFASTVCVMLSQYDTVADKIKGQAVGASAYLSKPFTTQELVTMVRMCITEQNVANKSI